MDLTVDFGHVDGIDGRTVIGWAFGGTERFAAVDIFLDGVLIGTALADHFRADLKEAGIADGCCAFRFPIPEAAITGGRQVLTACLKDSDRHLKGTPIEIMGVGASPSPRDSGQFLVNPRLEQPVTPQGVFKDGRNPVAAGVWIEASRNIIGVGSYRCEVFDGFHFGPSIASHSDAVSQGIRIQVPERNALVRVFHEMRPPNHVLVSRLTLSFALRRHGAAPAFSVAEPTFSVKVGIGCIVDGSPSLVWSRRLRRLAAGLQEFDISVEPQVMNAVARRWRDAGAAVVAVVEIHGAADVTVSSPCIALGPGRQAAEGRFLRDFEDTAVRDQWPEIEQAAPCATATAAATAAGYDAGRGADRASEKDQEWVVAELPNVPEIVVPVFNAPKAVADCLAAIRDATPMPHLLTLVDDGSFSETARLLDRASAGNPWCRVLRCAQNEGYTRAINRAIRTSVGRVVVLLNSDTIVTNGWLEGLLECLSTTPETMMAGPLSNAASWQSVPEVRSADGWVVNRLAPGELPEERARLLRSVSQRTFPSVPVLNGFCIAIRRSLFDAIGLFDEQSFSKGYGEENDFCLRAVDAGFVLRVADHVYVHHHKSLSFGEDRRADLSARANTILLARYGRDRLISLQQDMECTNSLNALRRSFAEALGIAAQ